MVEAFCDGLPYPSVSRQGLYQRVIMLLSRPDISDEPQYAIRSLMSVHNSIQLSLRLKRTGCLSRRIGHNGGVRCTARN